MGGSSAASQSGHSWLKGKGWLVAIAALLLIAIAAFAFWPSSPQGSRATVGEGPQFGGTLVYLGGRSREKPPGWDISEAAGASAMFYVNPYEEYLLGVDVLGSGPRGSNAFPFNMVEAEVPEQYLIGSLAESWEVTTEPLGLTFHIREGVMWTGNPRIGMEPREFTAHDAAFVLNRYTTGKQANKTSQFIEAGTFRAVDRYTLRVDFERYNASWAWVIGYALYSPMYPPEVVEAGPKDWRNAVGTGPFIIDDYVQGSYVAYRRNPDWWNREKVIDGTTYQTPFIDELILPIITSPTTQLAAIRTGQVDIANAVPMVYEDALRESGLEVRKGPSGRAMNIIFNTLQGPGESLMFRRAVMIAIDQQSIIDAVMPGGSIAGYPLSRYMGDKLFTPVDQMPDNVAQLYGHDPDAARALFEESGHAGAELPIYYSNADGRAAQAAAVMADQLTEAGISPVLLPVEPAVLARYENSDPSWEGALIWFASNSSLGRGVDNLRSIRYTAYHNDAGHNERMDRIMAMTDSVPREAALKQEAVGMIGAASNIAIGEEPVLTVWWPWVRNYFGEVEAGYHNLNPMFSTLWIDQQMKEDLQP